MSADWLAAAEAGSAWLQARPAVGIAAVLGVFAALVLGLAAGLRGTPRHPESLRKGVHVAMGLVTLSFPWLFDRPWPVWLMAGLAFATMLALRGRRLSRSAAGRVLHGVDRNSLGDLYFPVSVAVLFTLVDQGVAFYVVSILVLTLADATAALVGLRYGTVRLQAGDSGKSLEGWAAFFIVGFFSVHVPLLLFTPIGRAECLLIALTLALLVSLAELISTRGVDNLIVPLGCYALLRVYDEMSADELVYRFAAATLLVGFAAVWQRRSTLDHAALIASALFGYFALMIAGWPSLIPAALLLVVPAIAWPRRDRPSYQDVGVVMTDTALPSAMLLGYAVAPHPVWLALYGLGLSHHLGCVIMSFAVWDRRASPARWMSSVVLGVVAAIAVAACYAAWVTWSSSASSDRSPSYMAVLAGASVLGSTGLFALFLPSLVRPPVRPMRVHLISNAVLVAASVAVGVLASMSTP